MNCYTFKSGIQSGLLAWLYANVGRRFRLTRRTHNLIRRGGGDCKTRRFHSMVKCRSNHSDGVRRRQRVRGKVAHVHCHLSKTFFSRTRTHEKRRQAVNQRRFHARPKPFMTRYVSRPRTPISAVKKIRGQTVMRYTIFASAAVTLLFDNAADMVWTKLYWHDKARR